MGILVKDGIVYSGGGGNSKEPKTWMTTGAGNAYILTPDPPITAYEDGQRFRVKFHTPNTSTIPTININGLGAKQILRAGSIGLLSTGSSIGQYSIWDIEYSSSANSFVLVGTDAYTLAPQAAAVAGTATSPYWWSPLRVAQAVRGVPMTGLTEEQPVDVVSTDNLLQSIAKLQAQIKNIDVPEPKTWTTTGTGSAYVLTPDPPITEYKEGQRFRVKFHASNASTNPTININGLGPVTIRRAGNVTLLTTTYPIYTYSIWDIEYTSSGVFTLVGTEYSTIATQAVAEAGASTTPFWWTPQRVAQAVRGVPLTGLTEGTNEDVVTTDNLLKAIAKLQAQLKYPTITYDDYKTLVDNGQDRPGVPYYTTNGPSQVIRPASLIRDSRERVVGWQEVPFGSGQYKLLYEATEYVASLPTGLASISYTYTKISNVHTIEFIGGKWSTGTLESYNPMPLVYAGTNISTVSVGLTGVGPGGYSIAVGQDRSDRHAYLTFRYTKTTDTAVPLSYIQTGGMAGGDMSMADYDQTGEIINAGGVKSYFNDVSGVLANPSPTIFTSHALQYKYSKGKNTLSITGSCVSGTPISNGITIANISSIAGIKLPTTTITKYASGYTYYTPGPIVAPCSFSINTSGVLSVLFAYTPINVTTVMVGVDFNTYNW